MMLIEMLREGRANPKIAVIFHREFLPKLVVLKSKDLLLLR